MNGPDPEDRLAPWLRGELDEAEERAWLAAARSDAAVAREVEDYRRLLAELRALPREAAPDRDLYPSIAARLPAPRPGRARVPLSTAALAAGLALLVGAAVAWRLGRPPRVAGGAAPAAVQAPATPGATAAPPPGALARTAYAATDRELARIADELRRAVEARADGLPPATRRLLFENLRVIDRAIRDVESALARDPADAELARTWIAYRRREIDLLRQANRAAARL
jgi:hypothetical protein